MEEIKPKKAKEKRQWWPHGVIVTHPRMMMKRWPTYVSWLMMSPRYDANTYSFDELQDAFDELALEFEVMNLKYKKMNSKLKEENKILSNR